MTSQIGVSRIRRVYCTVDIGIRKSGAHTYFTGAEARPSSLLDPLHRFNILRPLIILSWEFSPHLGDPG